MPEQDGVAGINIPEELRERLERRLPRTEFETIDEYATYVLEEVLYEVEQNTDDDEFEAADEQEVKSRLESLGYLNE